MAALEKETIHSVDEAAELLDEIVDRATEGERILVEDGEGRLVRVMPIARRQSGGDVRS